MIFSSFFHFMALNFDSLIEKLLEHINLAISATIVAIVIGVPLGIWITRQPKVRGFILGLTSIFQTIPSLALLAFLIPILGIGTKPTIVTLVVYALLPITRNTYTGLTGVSPDSIEAARGLGFTPWQRLRLVELPLAMPVMVAGIRTATAMTIGITTIAAFIGAGGLGDFITQGLALDNSSLILLGAIPTALLALLLDFFIAQLEKTSSKRQRRTLAFFKLRIIFIIALPILLIFIIASKTVTDFTSSSKNIITIGSKNFTEQFILSNMMADLIKAKTHLTVHKKFNLGTTTILQNALLKGSVDLYPEYTGTAYIVVLKQQKKLSPQQTFDYVKNAYRKKFNLVWLPPFGFNDSQTLAVRAAFAKRHNLKTMSDLVPLSRNLTIAAPAEFIKRPDAFPGLQRVYHFHFKKILQVQPDLMYQAIKNKDVEVIAAFSTDGRIKADNLVALIDNKHFYPPYYAAPVIRAQTLKRYPKIRQALAPLTGLITTKIMQHLNYEVDVEKQTPAHVARTFLIKKGLIKGRKDAQP